MGSHFAPDELVTSTRKRLEAGGMGWGELKEVLFEVLNAELGPLRTRYNELMRPESDLDRILASGAETARSRARTILIDVRQSIGIA
jgi:tryptophanyl-tRNA synthetase